MTAEIIDLHEYITNAIEVSLDRRRLAEEESIGKLRREIQEDWLPAMKGYAQRMAALENMINAHASGVQNVYDQFRRLIDSDLILKFNEIAQKNKKEIADMKATLAENNEFVKRCHKKIENVNNFYSLRNADIDLVAKIKKIIDVIED